MAQPRHVFISYSHRDRPVFDRVKTALLNAGIAVWSDEHIEPGSDSWQGNIEEALENAGCVVALLSPDAKKSIWVRKELNYAQIHQVQIFGLLVRGDESTSVPFALSGSQHVDIRDNFAGINVLLPRVKATCEPDTEDAYITPAATPPIRIVIADDHRIVRKGLATLLVDYDDIQVIGEADDGEHAIELCLKTCPDVVLMDMNMPRKSGLGATQAIVQACPGTQVLVLTSFGTEEDIQAVLKAGAIGFLVKNVGEHELAEAIRRAHHGNATLAPEAADVLVRAAKRAPLPGHDLTPLEIDVLRLMTDGLNDHDIAERLALDSVMLRNYITHILQKLGTNSRAQAIALAAEHKIVG